jgi:hypothetical protein
MRRRAAPICGIRPVTLKALLRKGSFDTPAAMQLLGLEEPEVTQTLTGLMQEGWIAFGGETEGVHTWRLATKGRQMLALSRELAGAPVRWSGREPRPWPPARRQALAINLTEEQGHLAQHLWANGLGSKDIATKVGAPTPVLQGYLSSRAFPRGPTALMSPSLKETLVGVLPEPRRYDTTVTLSTQGRESPVINVELADPAEPGPSATLRFASGRFRVLEAAAGLIRTLEALGETATSWHEHMLREVYGLELQTHTRCRHDEELLRLPAPRDRVQLHVLMQPLETLLEQLWSQPRSGGQRARLTLELSSRPAVRLQLDGRPTPGRLVPADQAREVLDVAHSVIARFEAVLEETAEQPWLLSVERSER